MVVKDRTPGNKVHARTYRELNGIDALKRPAQSLDLSLTEALWNDVETELG